MSRGVVQTPCSNNTSHTPTGRAVVCQVPRGHRLPRVLPGPPQPDPQPGGVSRTTTTTTAPVSAQGQLNCFVVTFLYTLIEPHPFIRPTIGPIRVGWEDFLSTDGSFFLQQRWASEAATAEGGDRRAVVGWWEALPHAEETGWEGVCVCVFMIQHITVIISLQPIQFTTTWPNIAMPSCCRVLIRVR